MTPISSQSVYRRQDYQFARQRADRMYVPLERSPANFRSWRPRRPDVLCAIGIIIFGYVIFPALELFVAVMGWGHP